MRVLVIEDFKPLRDALMQGLREAGYAVDEAPDGKQGLWLAQSGENDVIILDLMLPVLSGLEVLRALRRQKCPSYILILTARDAPEDRVQGLNLGADDYLAKPFVFAELLARVKALVRRKYEAHTAEIHIADLEIDTVHRSVRRAGKTLELSGREYAMLEYLAFNANHVVSRTDLWEHVYDFNGSPESNVIDVYIGLLRKKLDVAGQSPLIHTRRGQGYLLGERE